MLAIVYCEHCTAMVHCAKTELTLRPLSQGTAALKGDFTRKGKRTMTGLLHDGVNSVKR